MVTGWIFQIILFLAILLVLAIALGEYIAKIYSGKITNTSFILAPIEKGLYKVFGIDPAEEMDWKTYAGNVVVFTFVGFVALFVLLQIQQFLPLNPANVLSMRFDTAFNTAISYVTNTNWQSFEPESSVSYFTQMFGLNLQNFLSSGIGIAVGIAFLRSFTRKDNPYIGNFWVDLTKALIYILLPLALIVSLVLVSQGSVQNLNSYTKVHTVEGKSQLIAQGPAASQIAIKHLGTNGGGFFNSNSAHPYENPTPISDYVEMLSIMLIAAAMPFAFGALTKNRRQGFAIFAAMLLIFLIGLSLIIWSETHNVSILSKMNITHGMSMEGKEERIGILGSLFCAEATTVTNTGMSNAIFDSLNPIINLVTIFNMAIGEVVFGSAGTGIVGILIYAILTMFLIGLMIGRSPEIFGKKLEPFEMVMAIIVLISPAIMQLIFDAIAISSASGTAALGNGGPRGISEILYAFASAIGNNGSSLQGLNSNNVFYNITLGLVMLLGRMVLIIPALAIAGSLASKRITPVISRFPTTSPMFVIILVFVVIIIGALTFFPVLILGPYLEHLFALAGKMF